MRRRLVALAALASVFALAPLGWAHFQVLIPAPVLVTATGEKTVKLDIVFTHPMENGPAMEMGAPVRFGVLVHGGKSDLRASLRPAKVDGKTAYTATYKPRGPGDHVFYIEPAPYWEPAEGKMIIHYTKVVVNAYGEEEGWDAAVGFPVEIEPLTRPYGLWAGNLFRGIVKRHGRPVPFAEIEVEYYNNEKAVAVPADAFVTQVIKADANGVFAYAMPRAGWWAFAALVDGDEKMKSPEGKPVDVEWGGLLWVPVREMN